MKTHILGYPRIGAHREIKKACESYWKGQTSLAALKEAGKKQRLYNWTIQKEAGIDLIPSNDFSYYDHVLDMSLTLGAIPKRYDFLKAEPESDLYFTMARGYQQDAKDVIAMEMTKWFDTNYHYIVPEFTKDQTFELLSTKCVEEFLEARKLGFHTKPVLLGPVSYLLLGKEKTQGFHRIELLDRLLPVYLELLHKLQDAGADWIQLDEPFLTLDLTEQEKKAYTSAYQQIRNTFPDLKILVATYFEGLHENIELAITLPICALHLDLVRRPNQLDTIFNLNHIPDHLTLSLGIVDGRNVWKNDFESSLALIDKAVQKIGAERILLAPSCSLLHTPFDLDLETDEATLPEEIKNWMSFARQKVKEVVVLAKLSNPQTSGQFIDQLKANKQAISSRKQSQLIHNPEVKERVKHVTPQDTQRESPFPVRQQLQHQKLALPLFPTTTIGSFPQTKEIRQLRVKLKKGEITKETYEAELKKHTQEVIHWQESIGLDILVHGEYERTDMVEYFGELLEGFVFTQNGWVQSYGSRGVKPPIIFGDVARRKPMTVAWSSFAQQQTNKPVKGMLTGPITILQWSFVRDDQPREETAMQIALAIRDEVADLEKTGIGIIQIDEPAIREGLPLRKADWHTYLQWAVKAFKVASTGVKDETQIHTHMCYSEFNDIIPNITALDADVITIETSRSQMELLDAFAEFQYPNEIGPGVYDIHSPRVSSTEEMEELLQKAMKFLPARNIWVNPDCGLKTRGWKETEESLKNMVQAAQNMRQTQEVSA